MRDSQGGSLPDPDKQSSQQQPRTLLIDCAIAIAAILPLLLTRHLPLSDLPNHLARQFILRDLAQSPILQQFYTVHWQLVPNLALEIFVTLARQVMPIDMAVRAFCISTILLLFFGTRLISRALAGDRFAAYRIAPLLCYGGPFQFGFLSYCFGIGLALVFAGLYLRMRSGSLLRLAAVFLPCSFALLLCHLAAFGIFSIAVCSLEFGYCLQGENRRPRLQDVLMGQARILVFVLPSFILFKLSAPMSGAANEVIYSTLQQRAESLMAITVFSSPVVEILLLALAIAGLLAALFLKVVRLSPAGYVMAAAFAVTWLLLPRSAMGGGYVDYRLPWAASFFLLSALFPAAQYEKLGAGFGYGFGALVFGRIALIGSLWLAWEPTLAAIDNALSRLPLGARVMVVRNKPPSTSQARQPTLEHVAAYAVARRQAFEPNIYSDVSGQILHLREPYNRLWLLTPPTVLDKLAPEYNYVLVLWPQFTRISPHLALVCEESGPNFNLFRVALPDNSMTGNARRAKCPQAAH